MRAQEIITLIEWPEAMPVDRRHQVEDAIRALDAKAYGNERPTLGPMQMFHRLEQFVKRYDTARDAAEALGILPGFLSQIRNSTRPCPDSVLRQLGLCRVPRGRDQYLEL
jgi:hypothetical protein